MSKKQTSATFGRLRITMTLKTFTNLAPTTPNMEAFRIEWAANFEANADRYGLGVEHGLMTLENWIYSFGAYIAEEYESNRRNAEKDDDCPAWMTEEERQTPVLTLDEFVRFASQSGPSPALEQFRAYWLALPSGMRNNIRSAEWLVLFAIFVGDDTDPRFQPVEG